MRTRTTLRSNRKARGAAMVEFCLTVPLLAAVFVLIFFCGWSFSRMQRVSAAARYAADHRAQRGHPSEAILADRFFSEIPVQLRGEGCGCNMGVLEDFVDEAGTQSQWAWSLMRDQVDRGRRSGVHWRVTGDFPTDLETYERLGTQLSRRAGRTDRSWDSRNFRLSRSVESVFLPEWITLLENMPSPSDHLARDLHHVWRHGW
jgi:hypothetical protein